MDSHVVERFVTRPGARGFRVVDVWTGETVVIAMTPQDEMSQADAAHTAAMLNRRAAGGERRIYE